MDCPYIACREYGFDSDQLADHLTDRHRFSANDAFSVVFRELMGLPIVIQHGLDGVPVYCAKESRSLE